MRMLWVNSKHFGFSNDVFFSKWFLKNLTRVEQFDFMWSKTEKHPETEINYQQHLKIAGWKTIFLLGYHLFRVFLLLVSGRVDLRNSVKMFKASSYWFFQTKFRHNITPWEINTEPEIDISKRRFLLESISFSFHVLIFHGVPENPHPGNSLEPFWDGKWPLEWLSDLQLGAYDRKHPAHLLGTNLNWCRISQFQMDGNGETTSFHVKIWFIIQLKQPFICGWPLDQEYHSAK